MSKRTLSPNGYMSSLFCVTPGSYLGEEVVEVLVDVLMALTSVICLLEVIHYIPCMFGSYLWEEVDEELVDVLQSE